MLFKLIQRAIINDDAILCPMCKHPARTTNVTGDTDTDIFKGNAVCISGCIQARPFGTNLIDSDTQEPLDISFICCKLDVETHSTYGCHYKYTLEIEEETDMSKVFVVSHVDAKNLIIGVFTNLRAAREAKTRTNFLELAGFDCEHKGESFPVWVVSIGQGKSHRVIGVYNTQKVAAKIASSIGGRIRESEALPQRRKPRNVPIHKSYVTLGTSAEYRANLIDEYSVPRRTYPGEEKVLFPVATFRRAYLTQIPHRIEILALTHEESLSIAKCLAELTDEEICSTLEYNVDYALIKDADGFWRIDPCLLNQPA